MLGSVIQMWTMLIAILESVRIFLQIRERSPQGPPRARRAFLSSPHTELIMWGKYASAPVRRSVSLARMRAMTRRLSGSKTGAPLR